MNLILIAVNAMNTALSVQEQQEAAEANEASCMACIRSFDRAITTTTRIVNIGYPDAPIWDVSVDSPLIDMFLLEAKS